MELINNETNKKDSCYYNFLVSSIGCDKDILLSESQLPSEIKTYVNTHFSDYSILQVTKDKDGFELTYDVILSEWITLEFNRKKEIIGIDGNKNTKLFDSVISEKILTYVTSNYSNNYITEWKITDKKIKKLNLTMTLNLCLTSPMFFCDWMINRLNFHSEMLCIISFFL